MESLLSGLTQYHFGKTKSVNEADVREEALMKKYSTVVATLDSFILAVKNRRVHGRFNRTKGIL